MKKLLAGAIILVFIGIEAPRANPVTFWLACCKICKKGKACGDSCISKDYKCHKPKGCACNG